MLDKISSMGAFNESKNDFPVCDSMYYSVPSFQWLNEISRINRPLYDLLDSIKLADRSQTAYYYDKGPNSMNSFPLEAAYGDNIYPDAGFRLLALYRYWNIIEYFYPYRKDVTDKTWDSVLNKFIPLFVHAKSAEEYRSAIDCMGTYLKDNHTSYHYSDSILPSEKKKYYLPVFWDFVENELTVTDDFAGQNNLEKGDVIFLSDRNVLSFGETIVELIKTHKIGTVIGEPTSGTNGDAVIVRSPSMGYIFTGYKFLNHDGSLHHGIGVLPDIIKGGPSGSRFHAK